MLYWNRLWKSFQINLIIGPHHISNNCDPPLNAAMAIRIRVGVGEAYTECHDATAHNAFFLHLQKLYNISWYDVSSSLISMTIDQAQTSSNSQLRHSEQNFTLSILKLIPGCWFSKSCYSGFENWFQVFENWFHVFENWFQVLENWFQVFWQMFSGDLRWVQLCAMCNLTTSTKRTIYISADQQEGDSDRDKY